MNKILIFAFVALYSTSFGQRAYVKTVKCGEPLNTIYGIISDSIDYENCQLTFNTRDSLKVGMTGSVYLYSKGSNITMSIGIGNVSVTKVDSNVVEAKIINRSSSITLAGGKKLNQFQRIGDSIKFEEFAIGLEFIGQEYWENGSLKIKGKKSCNKKIGTWVEYFENGLLKSRYTYNDDSELDGEFLENHPNGSLKTKGWYSDGKKSSHWIVYDESGKILEEGYYRNGEKRGKWIEKNEKGKNKKVKYP